MTESPKARNATQESRRTASTPLVSVIVPSFNQGQFIEHTILSVLQQTYRPLELIIIDGASTDNTLEILHKYDGVSEVQWVSEPDRGHGDAVNKGFARCCGELVGWLNSDDVYFSKDAISYMVQKFAVTPDADVIYGEEMLIARDNTFIRLFLVPPYNRARQERRDLVLQPAAFMRRHVIEAEKLDLNYIGLDYEYWLRLGAKGYRLLHVWKLMAGDRQYAERQSRTKKQQIDRQNIELKKRMGINVSQGRLAYWSDRWAQALCRLRGIFVILSLIANRKLPEQLAFPGKIDSPVKLLYRQTFRSVVQDL